MSIEWVDSSSGPSPERLRILPMSVAAKRAQQPLEELVSSLIPDSWGRRLRAHWGPQRLAEGRYYLQVLPHNIVKEFTIDAGSSLGFTVTIPPWTERMITILVEGSGELIDPSFVAWTSLSGCEGDPSPSHRLAMEMVLQPTNPFHARAPEGDLLLQVSAPGYGTQEEVLPIRSEEPDPTFRLKPVACVIVRLGLEDTFDLGWLRRAQARDSKGSVLTPLSVEITARNVPSEPPEGRLFLDAEGPCELRFPPLERHGSLRSVVVEVARGESTNLTLTRDDLRVP